MIKTAKPERLNMAENQQKAFDFDSIQAVADKGKDFYRGCSIDRYSTAGHVA